jgi:two-component system, chemotaxis family, protein-glutamate methylesterase/glutaminase
LLENEKIRVMIIDDSALMRNLICGTLNDCEEINVVGTAINGKFGLKKLGILKPDVIILDLEMPEMNGIEFLKERNKLNFKTPVIILSSHAKKGAKITLDALALGASDFILKPSGSTEEITSTKKELIDMILALGKPNSFEPMEPESVPGDMETPLANKKIIDAAVALKRERSFTEEPPKLEIKHLLKPISSIPKIDILSIGISTGGPNALREILPVFPKDFPLPIAVVQHMPAGFTFEFAKSLNDICKLEVKEAEENDILKPGRVYIAPGDKHIVFARKKLANVIALDNSGPVNGHKPSADVLFESTAQIFGQNAIGLIMTGMGKDGAVKIGDIQRKGGITIAQDQGSSIVFGMPRCAIEMGNINLVSALTEIPETIFNVLKKSGN